MLNLREHLDRVRAGLKRLLESPTHELGRWGRLGVYQIRLWRFCGRQLRRDRLVTVAGDLTFKTLLGLIPVLVLFLLVIGFFSRGPELGRRVQDTLFNAMNITEIQVVIEGQEYGLGERVEALVEAAGERLETAATAAVGIAFLFFLSINVLATIEGAMNRIWQTGRRRPIWKKILLFWLVLTLGPPAVALAVYASGTIAAQAAVLPPWIEVLGRWSVGLLAVWFVLFVIYKLMPHLPVTGRAALTGAVVAGTLWHVVAKEAFGYYIQYAVGYGQVFGNLAIVPLFCIWVYLTWILVLFGCELAYVVQNFGNLERAEAQERERERGRFLASDFVGLMAAAVCAERFRRGDGPTTLAHLVEATGAARANLEDLLGRLVGAGVLAQTPAQTDREESDTAFLPARDPARLTVGDVLGAARGHVPAPADPAHRTLHNAVRRAYEALRTDRSDAARGLTVADLVNRADAPPAEQKEKSAEA